MNHRSLRCCLGLLSLVPALALAQAGVPPAPAAAKAPAAPVVRPVQNATVLPGKDGTLPPKKIREGLVTGSDGTAPAAGAPATAPGATTTQPVRPVTVLPGKDGQPPPPKAGVTRTTGDEDEMDDLDVQRRTAPTDEGSAAIPAPGAQFALGKAVTRTTGPAPRPGGSVARTTGDEDEMDDLDVQRRTAPTDEGAAPLATPGTGLVPKPGAKAARTTGDEDEMDDLDVQRRTAPGDLGAKPLPNLTTPRAGLSGPTALPATTPRPLPAKPGQDVALLPPVAPTAAAVVSPTKPQFRSDELIAVTFAGAPGNVHDWISLAPAGAPDDKYEEWTWLNGQTSGTHRFARLLKPGRYEIRLYHNWPEGKYVVKARTEFEVR